MVFSDFNPLGPKLKAQTPPKYALTAPTTSTQGYAVREKMLSISGEDFYVEREGGGRAFDIVGSNKVPFGVGGFVLDKMELKADGKLCGSIERRAVAMATARRSMLPQSVPPALSSILSSTKPPTPNGTLLLPTISNALPPPSRST